MILLRETELFIDGRLISSMKGARRKLNQPVKHKQNPVLVADKPWEVGGPGYGTVHYDPKTGLFRMWYQTWKKKKGISEGNLCLATSRDGVKWTKPVINKDTGTNLVSPPDVPGFQCPGIIRDDNDPDPARGYKMLFSCAPNNKSSSWMSSAGFSPDGIHWTTVKPLKIIPFSDTQVCPLWDSRNRRYMAILRFGPPNVRLVARTESEDFLPLVAEGYRVPPHNPRCGATDPVLPDGPHALRRWLHRPDRGLSQRVTETDHSRQAVDGPAGPATGLQPRRGDLVAGRWQWHGLLLRVDGEAGLGSPGPRIGVPALRQNEEEGLGLGLCDPVLHSRPDRLGDRIHFYYAGTNAKHWWTWTGDPPKLDPNPKPPKKGVGLATLRVDGFVSVEAGPKGGSMTTRPILFLGDTLTGNAEAKGGSLTVEALDAEGKNPSRTSGSNPRCR
ncbi:MAG: hypothetical protein Ct9H300mP1_25950 [Planctomycetaceae bacterium]|nr:MAG: hypothetical protein Ct9H300mP1_25950 [Planctomycetaceae bacterium]